MDAVFERHRRRRPCRNLQCTDFLGGPIPCVELLFPRGVLLYGQGPFLHADEIFPYCNDNNSNSDKNDGIKLARTKQHLFERDNVHGIRKIEYYDRQEEEQQC